VAAFAAQQQPTDQSPVEGTMETSKTMEKKPYTPPTMTEHGNAVQQTRGFGGRFLESYLNKSVSQFDVDLD